MHISKLSIFHNSSSFLVPSRNTIVEVQSSDHVHSSSVICRRASYRLYCKIVNVSVLGLSTLVTPVPVKSASFVCLFIYLSC